METAKCNKLILADDHILFRDVLANFIEDFKEFTVVATAANGKEVLGLIENGTEPDILLMDLNMPEMDGYETASLISKCYPKIKIVILSMQDSEIAIVRLLQIGVAGFLKKDINPDELHKALIVVSAGENYYSHEAAIRIASLLKKKSDNHLSLEDILLNDQEIKFLKLACTDMTYSEIARAMDLKLKHIENYRRSLFTKLQVDSRVGLAICAIKNGIISL